MYTIELKSQPEKFIRDLPKDLQRQVLAKIETLKENPVPARHIIITKIGDRKDVYL